MLEYSLKIKKMTSRIARIISYQKSMNPNRNILILLFMRVHQVIKNRLNNFIINLSKDSTFNRDEEMFMCGLFPLKALDLVISKFNPESVIDVGCGQGFSLKYFLDRYIDAIGIENSERAISLSKVKSKIIRFDLKNELNLGRQFSLVWCFEVIEHIHPKYENNFLNSLINHSDNIILSAAKPGQWGHGHFNEQEPEYWIDKFSSHGYFIDIDFTNQLQKIDDVHCENLLCFRRVN